MLVLTARVRLVLTSGLIVLSAFAVALFPTLLYAQTGSAYADRLTMTVSPPLFQLGLAPGAEWSSTIILRNGGESAIAVRASVENFSADGERGAAVFAPSGTRSEPTSHELATWVSLEDIEYNIPPRGEVRIPFAISIPKHAEPGGHYAAILIGPAPRSGEGNVSFSSLVSSLLFVKISGDIVEQGAITGLFPKHGLVQTQEVEFDLRFTNTGNVHVNPEGEIIIFNMFGRERGRILVDKQHRFGTVLPGASRLFTFEWKGERNFLDIGRYKAVALLAYGDEESKTAYKDTHFWVVPWFALSIIFSALTFFVWFTRRALRRYIREAIAIEEARMSKESQGAHKPHASGTHSTPLTLSMLRAPLQKGGADLRKLRATKSARGVPKLSYGVFLKRYSAFIGSVLVIVVGFILLGWYFYQVFTAEREYQMIIKKSGSGDVLVVPMGE